jgi:methionyl-tRNA synthetase
MEFRKAFSELRAIWVVGNEYLQIAAPWTTIKDNKGKAAASVRCALNLIVLFAALSKPVIPFTADKMFAIFDLEFDAAGAWPKDAAGALSRLKGGEAFATPDVLFQKIEDEQVEEWRERFGAQ